MQVLIAGAGPVGLAAANVLADAGIEVEVLEAERELPQTLRASTFQPPTLDLLARFRATEQLIDMGRVAPKRARRSSVGGWNVEARKFCGRRGSASSTSTSTPASASAFAADRPTGPAPAIRTCMS